MWRFVMENAGFSSFLRRLRFKRGLGLREAARGLEISPSYLSKLERDKDVPPRMQVLERIAEFYGVPLDSLVFRTDNRRFDEVQEKTKESPNKAELYALFRAIQEVDSREVLMELLKKIYEGQGKTLQDLEDEIENFQKELPRLARGRENLLAAAAKPRFLSKIRLERIANDYLDKRGLGECDYMPPTPIERLVEVPGEIGLAVTDEWDRANAEGLPLILGMSRWSLVHPGEREIVVSARLFESTRTVMRTRLNFTLAHELFHAIEHLPLMCSGSKAAILQRTEASPTLVTLAEDLRSKWASNAKLGSWVKSDKGPRRLETDEDWREWQANYFAACLLMPRWAVEKEFSERFGECSLVTPLDLKPREYALETATTIITPDFVCNEGLSDLFGVSAQAMAIRLLDLGLVQ
jgi:HTH-type transcriptional regulator, competence development regulator